MSKSKSIYFFKLSHNLVSFIAGLKCPGMFLRVIKIIFIRLFYCLFYFSLLQYQKGWLDTLKFMTIGLDDWIGDYLGHEVVCLVIKLSSGGQLSFQTSLSCASSGHCRRPRPTSCSVLKKLLKPGGAKGVLAPELGGRIYRVANFEHFFNLKQNIFCSGFWFILALIIMIFISAYIS